MIPVLNSAQIKAVDDFTIANEPITSLNLMERAVDRLLPNFLYLKNKQIHIICRTGNNGGDGLVLARKLWHSMVHCRVTVADFGNKHSDEFDENLLRLQNKTEVAVCVANTLKEVKINPGEVIVDALFGCGLKRMLEGKYLSLVDCINQSQAEVYSIDMPSGLMSEGETPFEKFVHAVKTFVIQIPRISLFNPNHKVDFELVNIGLDAKFIQNQTTDCFLIEESDVLLKPRDRFAYKNTFGHLLIAGGSKGMYGAPVISAKAAFKSGAGLVSCLVPERGSQTVHNHLMEAMVQNAGIDFLDGNLYDLSKYKAIAIGMGMGQEQGSFKLLVDILMQSSVPVLMDADALNLIAKHNALDCVKPGSVLTPHTGEFKRLVGEWVSEKDRLHKLKELAVQTQSVVVLKGTYTVIAEPAGTLFFNITGSASLATAGAGDMLSGMIGAFLVQGYSPLESAMRGVYYHGKVGSRFMGAPVRVGEIINAIQF